MGQNPDTPTRSNDRRTFLRGLGATASGLTLVPGMSSAGGLRQVGTVPLDSCGSTHSDTCSVDTTPQQFEKFKNKLEYGGGLTGQFTGAVYEWNWGCDSGLPYWEKTIQVAGDAVVFDSNDDLVPNILVTEEGLNFDHTKNNHDTVDTENNGTFVGAHSNLDPGTDPTDAQDETLEKAFDVFTGFLSIAATLLNYETAGLLTLISFFLSDGGTTSADHWRRVWDWNDAKQTSWWTKYQVRLNAGQDMQMDVSNAVSLFGAQSDLFAGAVWTCNAPDHDPPSTSTTWFDITEASLNTPVVLGEKGDVMAFSGDFAMNHPEMFKMSEERMDALNWDDVVLRAKSPNRGVRQKRPSEAPDWVDLP